MADKLTPREVLFVAEVIKGTAAEHAAVAAGWSKKYARKNTHLILKRAAVQAAIEQAQEKIREQAQMTAEKLLAQLKEDRECAREWKQGTAMVRASEMVGKLTGLLVDKMRLEIEPKISLETAIDAGRARAGLPPRIPREPELIDITPAAGGRILATEN
jgi:hypothetical protein